MSDHPIVCAWCGQSMHEGDATLPVSHGICGPCTKTAKAIASLEHVSQEALDTLPFGAVQLDRTGTIVGYNQFEASLSGCTPANVLGRNFFTEVAPCTDVQTFKGVFDELQTAQPPLRRRIDFTFEFASRNRDVAVRIAMLRDGDVTSLLIDQAP